MTSETPRQALFLAAAGIAAVLLLAGCNTTAGIGEDVEAAGDELEEAAESNKGY
jgi:predicted small secreted protein